MTYTQNRNRLTDIVNKFNGTKGKKGIGRERNQEFQVNIHILLHIKLKIHNQQRPAKQHEGNDTQYFGEQGI